MEMMNDILIENVDCSNEEVNRSVVEELSSLKAMISLKLKAPRNRHNAWKAEQR